MNKKKLSTNGEKWRQAGNAVAIVWTNELKVDLKW